MGAIDAETLGAARHKGAAKRQMEVNKDQIAALLGMQEDLKRPDEVCTDEAWEICVVWRSEFGRVEIGAEEDGSIGCFASRTLGDKHKEGNIQARDADKLRRIFSWLESDPAEI